MLCVLPMLMTSRLSRVETLLFLLGGVVVVTSVKRNIKKYE
jgi:hypothetical protein